jgi:UrcA family protein
MSQRLINVLPVVAALALGGFASAGTPAEFPTVVVKYGDLNLDSQAGIAALHARLRQAAETVCEAYDSRVLGLREEYQRCISDALTNSVGAVGNQNLTQYHRNGGRFGVVAAR